MVPDNVLKMFISDAFQLLGKKPWPLTSDGVTQADIVFEIIKSFETGKTNVILSSPVGSGKSIIAAATSIVAQQVLGGRDRTVSHLLSPTKILSDQYTETFNGSDAFVSVKGAANFKCIISDDPKETAESCTLLGNPAQECFECGYLKQKSLMEKESIIAFTAPTAFGMISSKYAGISFRKPIVSFYDEAHTISDVFSSVFSIKVNKAFCANFEKHIESMLKTAVSLTVNRDLSYTKGCVKNLDKAIQSKESSQEVVRLIEDSARSGLRKASEFKKAHAKADGGQMSTAEEKAFKKAAEFERFCTSILAALTVETELAKGYDSEGAFCISPITPGRDGFRSVSKSDYNVFMSGTILPAALKEELGLEENKTVELIIPYLWDRNLKPVITFNTNKFIRSASLNDPEFSAKYVEEIAKVALYHIVRHSHSGLIIPPSFKLGQLIKERIISSKAFPTEAKVFNHDKDTTSGKLLKEYTSWVESGKVGVLISPGIFEGVNAYGDLARFVIIPKAPYANISDPRIKVLADKYHYLYKSLALNKAVQAIGRGVRGPSDWCATYIFDKILEGMLDESPEGIKNQFRRIKLNSISDIGQFVSSFIEYTTENN